jgi:hypothetical protein
VALGYELTRPARAPLSIEAYYRSGLSGFFERHALESSLAGVQVGLSWYSRKSKAGELSLPQLQDRRARTSRPH